MKSALRILAAAALMAAAGHASAASCAATVESNDQMKFNTSEIVIDKSCKTFDITLKHVGKLPKTAMGHNLVITKTADMQGVTADGMKAGAAAGYLKAGDARVLGHTKMLGGGESDVIKLPVSKLQAGGDYSFFCSFPGHGSMMKGKVVLK